MMNSYRVEFLSRTNRPFIINTMIRGSSIEEVQSYACQWLAYWMGLKSTDFNITINAEGWWNTAFFRMTFFTKFAQDAPSLAAGFFTSWFSSSAARNFSNSAYSYVTRKEILSHKCETKRKTCCSSLILSKEWIIRCVEFQSDVPCFFE